MLKLRPLFLDVFHCYKTDENDFIIVLAASNDVHHNEPAQLTVTQGIRYSFSLDRETNILVNQVSRIGMITRCLMAVFPFETN